MTMIIIMFSFLNAAKSNETLEMKQAHLPGMAFGREA